MGHDEFRRQVEEQASALPSYARDWAIKRHISQGQTENWRVHDCIVLAKALAADFIPKGRQGGDAAVTEDFDTAATFTASMLQESIAPEVERLRAKLFDDAAPPFPSHEEAAEWLSGLRVERRDPEDMIRGRLIMEDWWADPRREEFEKVTGVELRLEPIRAHLIPYVAPGSSQVIRVAVNHNSPFVDLATEPQRLADDTGLNEASVVLHVLCGSPLLLPSIRITKTLRFGGRASTVHVDFNSPDVTHAQIASVLKSVREFWGKSGRNRMNKQDARFLEIIDQCDGVPDSGRKAFFEMVLQVCVEEGVGSYEKSGWRGPYRRWMRHVEREGKLGTKEETP